MVDSRYRSLGAAGIRRVEAAPRAKSATAANIVSRACP
jgi:hypothetical protein